MNQYEFIRRYGEVAWEKHLQQKRDWEAQHPEKRNAYAKKWRENNPDKVKANSCEASHKGGKYYESQLRYYSTGLPLERKSVRRIHRQRWGQFKKIIAPDSQIHHEWLPGTADYRGVALVEADQHIHGYIDVIQILEGEIALLTEAEIRGTF